MKPLYYVVIFNNSPTFFNLYLGFALLLHQILGYKTKFLFF